MDDLTPDLTEELAFKTLKPLAVPTELALERTQAKIDETRKLVEPIRATMHPSVRAATVGMERFGYLTKEATAVWNDLSSVRKLSDDGEERGNIYRWLLGAWVLRIKHEPVLPRVAPGERRLFQLQAVGGSQEMYLSWDNADDYTVRNPRFVTLDEPRLNISLAQLLAHVRPPDQLPQRVRTLNVRSKLAKPQRDSDRG